ncbi:M6 family metalloprotease protein [Rutstroemia sp. NJR-2017a BBW]|nr:M6 family metalloprotease protein [Rutstroemia sp. NJR-2017a BBW]
MVKQAEPQSAPMPSMPTMAPSNNFLKSKGFRQFSAFLLIILLYTAATPFSPIAWLTSELEGSFLLDRLLAGALLFSALYFQWQIACQSYPIAICLPTGSRTRIQNGNIVQSTGDVVWIYDPSKYGQYALIEVGALLVAEWAGSENLRRGIVSLVIAALWGVGWSVTPESVKREGWALMKKFWFWIALDELFRVGRGAGGARRRRAW